MSLINRIITGLVFKDDFSSDILHPFWQVSPSDNNRYSLTEKPGTLRLKHGDPDLFVLMNAPRYNFVFEADTDYTPIRASDQGGISAFRDIDSRVEMLEYYEPKTGTTFAFNHLRMIRKGDLFEGYGSNDNGKTWELIGVSYLDAPKIGLVLQGVHELDSDTLDISEVRVYRSTTIQVGNLVSGLKAKIIDAAGTTISERICPNDADYVDLDVTTKKFPLKAKVQIYDASNQLLDETDYYDDIWGGDVFWYGIKLDLEVDGVFVREDREHFLGNMNAGSIEKKIYVMNNNDVPIQSVRIQIASHSEYFGWQWADIAPDVFGQQGTYVDELFLGTIKPGDKIPVWIKVKRQPQQQMASLNDYKFRIVLQSG